MAGKNRGKPKQEREDPPEASSTAIQLSTTGTGIHTVDTSDQPLNSDTGTPLPDDLNVLKENVKGLKSQLRRHKRKVMLRHLIEPCP